jgi:enediyne biosynthesis protein E4
MGYGQFKDVSSAMGPGISEHYSSRGADLPSLLRNDGGNQQNCIKCKLIGTNCNRTAIRARVRVVAGGHAQMDEAHSGSRVMSQGDPRLHFGLGKTETVDLIEEVKWPTTGKIERFTRVKSNQILTIQEGSGIMAALSAKAR